MTTIQSMMLSVCFGAVMGILIANVVFIVHCAIDEQRKKKRRKSETSTNETE